jgi:hypothetical protein
MSMEVEEPTVEMVDAETGEQVIKELEKQIRMTESVNSGWVYLTIEKAKKALELLKEKDDGTEQHMP